MMARFIVIALLAVSGCAGGDPPEATGTTQGDAGSDLVRAVEGVCAARDAALDSAERADNIFVDRAHDGIHRLAEEIAAIDRKVAAAVLEAKQAAESAAVASDVEKLHDALARLAAASGDALAELGLDVPACASEGG